MFVDILGYFVGEPSKPLEVAESRTFHGVHLALGRCWRGGTGFARLGLWSTAHKWWTTICVPPFDKRNTTSPRHELTHTSSK